MTIKIDMKIMQRGPGFPAVLRIAYLILARLRSFDEVQIESPPCPYHVDVRIWVKDWFRFSHWHASLCLLPLVLALPIKTL